MSVKAVILMDSESKNVIRTSVSGLGVEGFRFISDLGELNDEIVSESNRVIIFEGITLQENYLNNLELYQALYGVRFFFLGSKRFFTEISKVASCFECELKTLTIDVVDAALYGDSSLEEPEAESCFDYYCDAKSILSEEARYDSKTLAIAKGYLSMVDVMGQLREQSSKLEEENKSLSLENEKLVYDRKRLLGGYQQVISSVDDLNKSLKRYEEIFTSDIYEKIRLHDYVNKPLILYFKEYEDFLNLDELLETLFNVFRLQQRMSVKVLRLFDSSSSGKMITLPDYYRQIRNHYLMSEVISSEFIAKTGDYRRILEKLLVNEAGLDVLILVDSKNYEDIILTGSSLQMNLCREEAHARAFGLNVNNTILNDGDTDSEFYWGYYKNTDVKNANDRFLYLSSRPVIQNILTISRVFGQSV